MELSPKQQTIELIKKSNQILVTSSNYPTGDAIGSILALGLTLKKMGKEVVLISSELEKEAFKFLPALDEIQENLKSSNDLVVSVDISKTEVEKLSYNTETQKLNIIVTPKEGSFKTEDVTINKGKYKCDLIIVLDTQDVEHIDKIYDENTKLFFETPIINIDHKAKNDYFGTVNLIDLTATSTAEILVSVIESLNPDFLDDDIATCLLTGVIADTASFRNSNTTPKSFTVAAQLLAAGARQQEIVQHLFKTKPLRVLKLLGRIFSKAQVDPETHLVWSTVTKGDLVESHTDLSDLNRVAGEFAQTTSNSDIILLLIEDKDKIIGKLRFRKGYDFSPFLKIFSGTEEDEGITFELKGVSLSQAEKEVKRKISQNRLEGDKSKEVKESPQVIRKEVGRLDKTVSSEIEDEEEETLPVSESEILAHNPENNIDVWRSDEE